MREIVLDTETTGFEPETGDRIVEIGAVELSGHLPTGRTFHVYINPERVMPDEARAEIKVGSWEIPGIFHLLQEQGEVATEEMFRVFNMGVGMVLIIDPASAGEILRQLREAGEKPFPMGTVQRGESGVVYDLPPGQ